MALGTYMTMELLKRLKAGARIASMGYPDMIAPLDYLEEYADLRSIDYRKDSPTICRRHGIAFRGIPDAHSFFGAIGAKLDVYDVVKERGCEIIFDLNYPLPFEERYDFVLDVGTLEHCFNIGQAALNMAGLLKDGGIILHENPFNWGNHGFYGLNPTWYADFYGQPGFRLLDCKMLTRDGRVGEAPLTKRFVYTETEVNVFAVAERTKTMPIAWSVQTKYASLIPAAGATGEKEAA